MELSEEARAEIAAAIAIAKSDGMHVHKSYTAFLKTQEEAKDKPKDEPKEGGPPPVQENAGDEYDEVATLWGTRKVKKDKPSASA